MTPDAVPARRGRRPAGEDTRSLIVEAARAEFAQRGYDGTSMRAVARAAGVDPALVHHYFEGKADLFAQAVVETQINPAALIDRMLAGPRETLGERIVLTFLRVWDDPADTARLVAMLRSVQSHDEVGALFRSFLTREIISRFVRASDSPDAELRGSLAASQIVGLATARYVVRLEPLASAPPEELARWLGPTFQRYLVGPP